MSSNLLILGLHRVGFPPKHAKIRGLFISPKLLEFQLSLIQKMGYRFATLKQALANPGEKIAVITFDDGYADNYTAALPVLQKFNAPATVFVITGDVGGKDVVWSEASEDLPSDILDWKSLAKLQNQGWEIGSHAHEHIHLARYEEEEQEATIQRSIREIEKNLGTTPVSFAYPYGSYNEATKRVLKRAGIKYAVTINPAHHSINPKNEDHLELSRCSLGGKKFQHYVKSVSRTSKALGKRRMIKNFAAYSQSQIARKLSFGELTLLSLQTANNDVMSSQ
jgi:peptidoglycan/xylan/chitin deacetylase (PgdA/CDA1 family)